MDVITVGNALIDTFLTLKDADTNVRLNPDTNELSVKSGQKIELESCIFELGENACNVAVGIARAGFHSQLVAEIGDDEFAAKIKNRLLAEKVDASRLQSKGQSSFAIGLNFQQERTLFVEHVTREHAFTLEGLTPQWMYLTSIGPKWEHVYTQVLEFIKQGQGKLALNPGTRQLAEGAELIKQILPHTTVFFVNKDEAIKLLGKVHAGSSEELLTECQKLGAKTVVMTDGDNGSVSIDESGTIYRLGVQQVQVVEKTGAGDAYATGFLVALLSGKDRKEAMRWGAVNAASVVTKVGAQPGHLMREQYEQQAGEAKELVVEEVK